MSVPFSAAAAAGYNPRLGEFSDAGLHAAAPAALANLDTDCTYNSERLQLSFEVRVMPLLWRAPTP